jgi:hypothetical protein
MKSRRTLLAASVIALSGLAAAACSSSSPKFPLISL